MLNSRLTRALSLSQPYHELLGTDGKLVLIGLTTEPHKVSGLPLLLQRQTLTGSLIGGIKRTQEMIDFCCSKNLYPEIELVNASQIASTLQRLKTKNDTAKVCGVAVWRCCLALLCGVVVALLCD